MYLLPIINFILRVVTRTNPSPRKLYIIVYRVYFCFLPLYYMIRLFRYTYVGIIMPCILCTRRNNNYNNNTMYILLYLYNTPQSHNRPTACPTRYEYFASWNAIPASMILELMPLALTSVKTICRGRQIIYIVCRVNELYNHQIQCTYHVRYETKFVLYLCRRLINDNLYNLFSTFFLRQFAFIIQFIFIGYVQPINNR